MSSVGYIPEPSDLVEGMARVVEATGKLAWLVPEQESSCGGCVSSALCNSKSGNSKNILTKRFSIINEHNLEVGEKVIVGIPHSALFRASSAAYGWPLLFMMMLGITADKLWGNNLAAIAGTLGGMFLGFGLAKFRATRMANRGELSPRFLRREFKSTIDCHKD